MQKFIVYPSVALPVLTVFTEKKGKTVTPSSTGYKTLLWCEKFIRDPDLINNKNAFMK